MNCSNCRQAVEVVKQRLYKYEGVRVHNLYLANVEVKVCLHCGVETPILRNVVKLHTMIGVALAQQPGRLAGDEVRFLRRRAGFKVNEWASRLGLADATYSRWENGHQVIGTNYDRLARLHFLLAIGDDLGSTLLSELNRKILLSELSAPKDYSIVLDMEDLDAEPRYLQMTSPLFAMPTFYISSSG